MSKSTIGKIIIFIVIGALMSASLLSFISLGFIGTDIWSHVLFLIQIINRLVKMALGDEVIKRLFWSVFAYLIFKFLVNTFIGIYSGINTLREKEEEIEGNLKKNKAYLKAAAENTKKNIENRKIARENNKIHRKIARKNNKIQRNYNYLVRQNKKRNK